MTVKIEFRECHIMEWSSIQKRTLEMVLPRH
jgi:hypothetical protein